MTCEILSKGTPATRRLSCDALQLGDSSALRRNSLPSSFHLQGRRVGEAGNQWKQDTGSSRFPSSHTLLPHTTEFALWDHLNYAAYLTGPEASRTTSVLRAQPLPQRHCGACALAYAAVFQCVSNKTGTGLKTYCSECTHLYGALWFCGLATLFHSWSGCNVISVRIH
jgi:hypothetical protein